MKKLVTCPKISQIPGTTPTSPSKVEVEVQNVSHSLSQPLGYYQNLEQGSQAWLEARKEFALTASEFGAALGLSKYKTPGRLLHMKRNNMTETFSPFAQKYILGWGQNNEINAVVSFEDHMGLRTRSCGLFPVESSDGRYLFAASPDRLVVKEMIEDERVSNPKRYTVPVAVLECKCPYTKKVYPQLLLKDCSIPNDHYAQVQAQLAATQLSEGYYVCWTPYHVAICLIKFDRELWTTYLRPQLEEFARMAKETTPSTTEGGGSGKKVMGAGRGSPQKTSQNMTSTAPTSLGKKPTCVAVMLSQQKHTSLVKQVQAQPLSPPVTPVAGVVGGCVGGQKRPSPPPTTKFVLPPKKRVKTTPPPMTTKCGRLDEVQSRLSPTSPSLKGLQQDLRRPPTFTSQLSKSAIPQSTSSIWPSAVPPFQLSSLPPFTL